MDFNYVFAIIIILAIVYWFFKAVIQQDDDIITVNINEMSKRYDHNCPFCHERIPKITETQTITKKRRHKVRIKKITVVIGEDWSTHVKTCQKLKDFLNKTK